LIPTKPVGKSKITEVKLQIVHKRKQPMK